MSKPVVGLLSVVPRLQELLSKKMPDIKFIDIPKECVSETVQEKEMKVLIADSNLLSEVMYELPGVEWVQGTWAGFDKVLANYVPEKPLPYVISRNAGPHFGQMMSEYVVTNLVALNRDFRCVWQMQTQQTWHRIGDVMDYPIIRDFEKISILGIGLIGNYVASVLKHLGAPNIWGMVQTLPDTKPPCVDVLKTTAELEEVLKDSRLIINILPGTNLTNNLLNIKNLSVCKEAIFMNCGRGTIITQADIIEAVNRKYFSKVVLDVFLVEPLTKDNPLWTMKEVFITPHVAAMPRAPDIAEVFCKNWMHWTKKEPLPSTLNFDKQY